MRVVGNNVVVHAPLPLDVAVHRLHLCTGHRWRASSLLSLAIRRSLRLLAHVPAGTPTVTGQIEDVDADVRPGPPVSPQAFAALLPVHLHQLLRTGNTATEYPEDFDAVEYVTRWFMEPVRVSLSDVFVPHQTMRETLQVWKAGKRGELSAHEIPLPIWHAVTRRLSLGQLENIAQQPELRFIAKAAKSRHSIVLSAHPLPPERSFAGQLQAFEQMRPRALWLMDFFYRTRDAWFVQRRNEIKKSNIARRVAGQLDRDGTRGPLGDRLSEKAVTQLVMDWVMPTPAPTPTTPAPVARRVRDGKPEDASIA
jgi:hypothetical protein